MNPETIRLGDDVSSGIHTDEVLEEEPYGFRVTWIDWDSPFRRTDLRIGDLVVGCDGVRYGRENRQTEAPRAIGQYHESMGWADAGATDGRPVTLQVLRGEETLEIAGELAADRFYYDAEGRRALGPGGPDRMKSDGFSGGWSGWYETFVKEASYVLDGGWKRSSFNNRKELAKHEDNKARVDHLAEHFPGPFAEAVVADWNRVREVLRGRLVPLTEEDLEYRELGAKRVETAKREAARARAAFLEEVAEEMIPPFPALDPIDEDRSQVVGKVVELPWITFRNFINDLGKSWVVAGSEREGFYFLEIKSPEMDRFFDAWFRYQGQVNPKVPERYRFVGRIRDDPWTLTYQRRPATGLALDALAGFAGGDELFVDLRRVTEDGTSPFAGEEILNRFDPVELAEDAAPAAVVEAMIAALKQGDFQTWRGLFTDWELMSTWGGPPAVDLSYDLSDSAYQRFFEDSRRLLTGDVYDARVAEVDRLRERRPGDPDQGIPQVEEVTVWVDHIGLVEGEYRAFADVRVHRRWTLRRLDKGPWRVASRQHL